MGLPAIVTPIDEEVREALAICKGNALDALLSHHADRQRISRGANLKSWEAQVSAGFRRRRPEQH